jgi:hypothetical protein
MAVGFTVGIADGWHNAARVVAMFGRDFIGERRARRLSTR